MEADEDEEQGRVEPHVPNSDSSQSSSSAQHAEFEDTSNDGVHICNCMSVYDVNCCLVCEP